MSLRTIYLLILITFINFSAIAQWNKDFCNEIEGRRTLRDFEKAIELLNSGKHEDAEKLIIKILDNEERFTEAWIALSEIYFTRYDRANNYNAKERFLKQYIDCVTKINETCPSFNNYEANYILGTYYFARDDNDRALRYFKIFLEKGTKNTRSYADAKQKYNYLTSYLDLINNPVPFEPTLVEGVSTFDDDYLPLIAPDGSLAFYTKAYLKKDISSAVGERYVEEFVVAEAIDKDGLVFTSGEPMPTPFNTGKNQGAATITIDNRIMYLTICEFVSRNYENCDLFYTYRKSGNSWSDFINLGPNINSRMSWESQPSISADGRTLYFSSIRESNTEFNPNNPTSDIYFSVKDEYGNWGPAQNMGTIINTSGNEKTPFIHSDSQTLYFASDGHPGVGGYDIFYSKFRDGEWSKPINIGYPINTPHDDLSFIVSTKGDKAYFASNKLKGKGGWDIYAFDLYEEARPERVFFAKGQIVDDDGVGISEARLEMRNVKTQTVSEGLVNAETGRYAIALTIDQDESDDYLMIVKKEGYSYTSALVNPTEEKFEAPVEIDFEVKPIEVGQTVELNDIYFATASYTVDQKSLAVLDGFIEFLVENPNVKLEIRGHTDNIGSYGMNMSLSEDRAKSVYNYILENGISSTRLSYKGFGPDIPVASNETEEGRAKNRRTEFVITGK
jgi:outer membrane protein OmpA-like peptidoglycan-associated protein/tetratricopeptide (TPR) repeat protein